MRGRASGFGSRISSMDLLIVVGNRLVGIVACEIHRTDYLLDEDDLTGGERIFFVEILVRPLPGPLLGRHERVNLARCVLGWLVQKNKEASQSTGEVGQNALGLGLGVKRTNAEIRLRRDAASIPDEWRTDNSMRISVLVTGPRRSIACEKLPLVDEVSASRDRAVCIPYRRSDRPTRHRRA